MHRIQTIPTADDILAAEQAIAPYIHQTPVLTSQSLNDLVGAEVYFKCENFQRIGAFKMRGAACAISALTPEERQRGVITHSSGNHAQAVASAARALGIDAHIVMPTIAPAPKRAATLGYGALIYDSAPDNQSRQAITDALIAEHGYTFVSSANDYNVIAGQATAAKELLVEQPMLDVLLAPVGAGGLLSGTALSARYFASRTPVWGIEPKMVDDAYRSLQSGRIEGNDQIMTIADGLRTVLSERTFGIIQAHVERIVRVEEASIVHAMRLMWERLKIVVEPSSAVPLAALLEQPKLLEGQRVGIIVTGGNVSLDQLPFCQCLESA